MVIELLAGAMRRGRGGIVAVEDMRQTYTVKHIRKGLPLLGSEVIGLWGPMMYGRTARI